MELVNSISHIFHRIPETICENILESLWSDHFPIPNFEYNDNKCIADCTNHRVTQWNIVIPSPFILLFTYEKITKSVGSFNQCYYLYYLTPWGMESAEAQYHIHKGSQIILSRINPISRIDTYFFEVHSNIILPSCRPRWSQGNVIASRSKVRGFISGWSRWIFQDLKILSTSSPGETLSWGCRVRDFRLVKEPQAWKNRPVSKI